MGTWATGKKVGGTLGSTPATPLTRCDLGPVTLPPGPDSSLQVLLALKGCDFVTPDGAYNHSHVARVTRVMFQNSILSANDES